MYHIWFDFIQYMLKTKIILLFFLLFCSFYFSSAQQFRTFTIKGFVLDDNDLPISGVSVSVLNKNTGTITNDSGYFIIKFLSTQSVAVVFSHTGFNTLRIVISTKNRNDSLIIHL